MVEWSPEFAPHIKGEYEERRFSGGVPEDQRWKARCTVCGATHQGICSSGAVRRHIKTFALVHLHRDPLDVKKVM